MAEKTFTTSDLRRKAQELIEQGKMPDLDTFLKAVADVRTKYKPMIEDAHKEQVSSEDLEKQKMKEEGAKPVPLKPLKPAKRTPLGSIEK